MAAPRVTQASQAPADAGAPSRASLFSAVWFPLCDPFVLFTAGLLMLSREWLGTWETLVSVGPKKGEIVLLSGLRVKSVLGDTVLTLVAMDTFEDMNFIPTSLVDFLE